MVELWLYHKSSIELFRSIFRDPDIFPDPEAFDPQRWINPEGKLRQDLRNFNFGFGRRYVLVSVFRVLPLT